MNPFSAFLQPRYQPVQMPDLSAIDQRHAQRRQEAQHALENTQQNDRANRSMKLQEDYQTHKFSKEDQAEVEGLLAEYQTAEDQGDQVGLSRAAQKLQRYGMEVSPQGGMRNVAAKGLPGPLPSPKAEPKPPVDQAVETELKSREALRARNAAPEKDLSQADFEDQLINGQQSPPDRYETSGVNNGVFGTTPEFKARLAEMEPNAPEEPTDMGDVDSPEFRAAAAAEAPATDLGDVDSPEFQASAAAESGQTAQPERNPAATGLPTQPFRGAVVSRGGKKLYESQGPSGRLHPMVQAVFEPFTQHENPVMAAAGKMAQQYTDKLINVDGIPPKEAIQMGMQAFQAEANRQIGLERTKIGSKPRGAAGGAAPTVLTGKEGALLADDADKIMLGLTSKPEYQKVQVMDDVLNGAESALNSEDPLRQQQAISDIMRARSGLTVRKDEEAGLRNATGLWEGLKSRISQDAGYGLTKDYKQQLARALAEQRAINQRIKHRMADEARVYYETTRTRAGETGPRAGQVNRNSQAIQRMLERGGGNGEQGSDSGDDYGGL